LSLRRARFDRGGQRAFRAPARVAETHYWAAEHRTDDANIADMSTEITALHLWQRYARDAWASLQASLRTLPVENLTTSREILGAAGQQVADTLRSSLETIGFRYEETSSGGRAFYSTRLDFPDHEGNS
jgi:hypothetical protein